MNAEGQYELRVTVADAESALSFLRELATNDDFRAEVEGATGVSYEGVTIETSYPPGAAAPPPLELPSKEEIQAVLAQIDEPFGHVERLPLGHIWHVVVLPFGGRYGSGA